MRFFIAALLLLIPAAHAQDEMPPLTGESPAPMGRDDEKYIIPGPSLEEIQQAGPETDASPEPEAPCIAVGCNGELCVPNTVENWHRSTACGMVPQAVCYKHYATCQPQGKGRCAWVKSSEFATCAADPEMQKKLEGYDNSGMDPSASLPKWSVSTEILDANTRLKTREYYEPSQREEPLPTEKDQSIVP